MRTVVVTRLAPLTRAPGLVWLVAHSHARLGSLEVLAYPVASAIIVVYSARRGVFESDDHKGMVIVTR